MCLLAAPEGIAVIEKAHPDVDIFVAAIDENSMKRDILFLDWEMLAIVSLVQNKLPKLNDSSFFMN